MSKAHILIVDDEENFRLSLVEAFREQGYTVADAASAQEALEAIEAASFDALLVDLVMPYIDGLLLLEKVRERLPEAVSSPSFERRRLRLCHQAI